MSVQISYKNQTTLGIILLLILFLAIEIIANVWWNFQIECEFEENEIFQNMNESQKRQMCVDLYEMRTSGSELIPNQSSDTININSFGFRGDEFSINKSDNVNFTMSPPQIERKLAAIMFTDIAGYTNQMSKDE